MKNLKKILSLSLAVVMVIGMMVIPASATSTTSTSAAALADMDQVKNVEAVSLLVDLGIINGVPSGNTVIYNPTGIVDRATMAKLVTLLHFASDSVSQFAGTETDLIDIDATWAESYIKYCYSQGIIAGDGLGNFNPAQQVSVAAAAKMLLVAIGYDADKAGLVGADWAVNSIKLASDSGLFNGMAVTNANTLLDRDSVALMMYNALFANEMGYNLLGGNAAMPKNNTLGLRTYGLMKVTGVVVEANDDTFKFASIQSTIPTGYQSSNVLANAEYKLGSQYVFNGKSATAYIKVDTQIDATNTFMPSVRPYLNSGANITGIYSSVLNYANTNVLATSNNGTAYSKLVDKTDSKFLAEIDNTVAVKYYWNGTEISNTANAIAEVANVGTVVEFIDNNSNGKFDTVIFTTYKPAVVTGATSSNITLNNSVAAVKTDGTLDTASASWKVADVLNASDFAKDDVVMAYVSNGKLILEKATSVDGTFTTVPSDKKSVNVDGTKYTLATNVVARDKFFDKNASDFAVGTEAVVYLDNNNYVMGMKLVESAAVQYAFLKTVDTNLYRGRLPVTLVLADGSTVDADIAKIKVSGTTSDITTGDISSVVAGDVVAYTVASNGTYTIENLSETDFTAATVKTGVSKVDATPAFYGNNATVFVNNKTGAVYTGIQNVPNMSGAVGTYYSKAGDTVATVVFFTTGVVNNATSDFVIFYDLSSYSSSGNNDAKYYTFKAVRNGALEDVSVNKDVFDVITAADDAFYAKIASTTTVAGVDGVVSSITDTANNTLIASGVPGATEALITASAEELRDITTATTSTSNGVVSSQTNVQGNIATGAMAYSDTTKTIRFKATSTAKKYDVEIIDVTSIITESGAVGTPRQQASVVVDLNKDSKADYVIAINGGDVVASTMTLAVTGTAAVTAATDATITATYKVDGVTTAIGTTFTSVTSSDTGIATVVDNADGTITVVAVAAGSVTITVVYDGITVTQTLTVVA